MTHTYNVSGMTCGSCEAKVKSALLTLPDVTSAEITRTTATITMSKHIALSELQKAISEKGNYKITVAHHSETAEQVKSWLETYKPVLLIFAYITTISLLIQITNHHFMPMQLMQHFMAGFFLTFSFFKLLNLSGFVESYAMYDVIAKLIPAWGYVYAFTELVLGIAYLINFNPLITNAATFILMSVSIIGVLQTVLNKKKIQCACLGAVFNLPMSTVTIIEDALMIAMSGIMLLQMI
ncbi:MAG: cation transporter [Sphingobacteriales bacterium]|nr:MAG: cation transporter [Sphingobacteriales bacterium]